MNSNTPPSAEDSLRLFVSLLGTKVHGIRSEDEKSSHPNQQLRSEKLSALFSSENTQSCTGFVNNPIAEMNRDENCSHSSSVSSSFDLNKSSSSLPSLAVFKPAEQASITGMTGRYEYGQSSKPLNTALENMSLPIQTSNDDVAHAVRQMASRALDSFAFLTVANTKQFFKIQLERHRQESTKDVADRVQQVTTSYFNSMTSPQFGDLPIDVSRASTSFQIVDIACTSDGENSTLLKANVTFNILIDATVHGAKTNAIVTSPASIEAHFQNGSVLIDSFNLSVDASKFLLSMRNQARAMVLKSVSHCNFPVISGTHESNIISDSVDSTSGSKMTKLALCASLELASVVANDNTVTLTNPTPRSPKRPGGSNKRRLSLNSSAKVLNSFKRKRGVTSKKEVLISRPPSLPTFRQLQAGLAS